MPQGVNIAGVASGSVPQPQQPRANGQRTLFVKIYGGLPGLEGLAPYIHPWRRLGQTRNKPFFASTYALVREHLKLAYALSYFKFFHVDCSRRWCEHV